MEFMRKRTDQLKATWTQLSPSGRLAIGMAVLLALALLVITAHYAGQRDLAALPATIPTEDLGRATELLRAQGIQSEIRGGQLYVQSGEETRSRALAVLSGPEALSPEIDWDKVLATGGVWASEADKQRAFQVAVKKELELIIRRFPGVRGAKVGINPGSERTLRSIPEGVTASVSVTTQRGHALEKAVARAMADLVAGAVLGLKPQNVNVIDDTHGQSFDLSSDSAVYAADYVQMIKAYQAHFEGLLKQQFRGIRNLVVGVHVVPNIDTVHEESHKVDSTQVIPGGSNERASSSGAGATAGTPGVTPNTGTGPGPGEARTVSTSDSEVRLEPAVDYGRIETVSQRPPGEVKEISVALSVPRSYLVDVAKLRAGTSTATGGNQPAAAPDEAAIQSVFNTEKDKIAQQAMRIIGAKDAGQVQVDWYYDLTSEPAAEESPAVVSTVMTTLTSYGPTAGLAVLALAALWMVFSVVRKVQPAAAPEELSPTTAEPTVSEAGLTLDSILEGVELEADTIRASKMQEQIANMIKEDPENVAGLFRRWMAQE